jgi:hypothetical protein
MSWLYSRVLVEEFLGENSLGGEQSVQSSGNPTLQAYLSPDKMRDFSRLSRFGMTFKPLTESRGEELLTLFRAGFPVKTSQQPEKAQESMENDQECGATWQGSLAKFDPDTSLWRTAQCSLLEDLNESLATLPRSGMTRNGLLWELPMLEQTIRGTESGLKHIYPTPTASAMPCEGTVRIMRNAWLEGMSLEEASAIAGRDVRKAQGKVPEWPTPAARDGKPTNTLEALADGRFVDQLANRVKMVENKLWTTPCARDWGSHTITPKFPNGFNRSLVNDVLKFPTPQASDCRDRGNMSNPAIQRRAEKGKQLNLSMVAHPTSGQLNPTWVEWLMGWPLGWTDLKPLETDKCPSALQQHGGC